MTMIRGGHAVWKGLNEICQAGFLCCSVIRVLTDKPDAPSRSLCCHDLNISLPQDALAAARLLPPGSCPMQWLAAQLKTQPNKQNPNKARICLRKAGFLACSKAISHLRD